ncbi:unnamed protein product [Gongylonema pulchrum]|uniref:Uncharacterized protein n=1 Tax=Gongylonema pulchrum TaxID=637853 RepID=A0A183EVH2_9BILA|nr:unnamed protein product [Gongylonema pulchrum]
MEILRRSSGDDEKGCCRRKTSLLGLAFFCDLRKLFGIAASLRAGQNWRRPILGALCYWARCLLGGDRRRGVLRRLREDLLGNLSKCQ